jgi:hypothetical protein
MVYFQTKNTNLGKFRKVFQLKMLVYYDHFVYFTVKWYMLWPFGTFCGHLVIFSHFGMLYREKFGNPGICAGTLEDDRINC